MQHSTTKMTERQGEKTCWGMEKHVGIPWWREPKATGQDKNIDGGLQITLDLRSHLYVNLFVLQHLLQLHQAVFEGAQFERELLCLSFCLCSTLQQQTLAVDGQLWQIRHLLLNLKQHVLKRQELTTDHKWTTINDHNKQKTTFALNDHAKQNIYIAQCDDQTKITFFNTALFISLK